MKNITDYFISPTKVKKSPESVSGPKSSGDQNVNTENSIKQHLNFTETSYKEIKKKKKKKRRKSTDLEVQNVTELLSSNLTLISPTAGGSKSQHALPSPQLRENEMKTGSRKVVKKSEDNTIIDLINCEPKYEEIQDLILTPKVNAFQFLMNSRNSVIGLNSEGKVDQSKDSSFSEEKQNLEARKNLFKSWSDQKGASKRKREEEEIEKCINVKMNKRAKRLKKLLQADKMGNTNEHNQKLTKYKKKVKRLSSSESENSTDLNVIKLNKAVKITSQIIEIIEENAQDHIMSKLSPSTQKKHKENGHNSLLNFVEVTKKDDEDIIEVFDESDEKGQKKLIKIKMFAPQSPNNRNSLMALNRNQTTSVDSQRTDESSLKDHKVKHEKKRHKTKNLNNSMDDFCSPQIKKSSFKNSSEINMGADGSFVHVMRDKTSKKTPFIKEKKLHVNSKLGKGAQDFQFERRTLRKRNVIDYKAMVTIVPLNNTKKNTVSTKKLKKSIKDESIEKVELSSDSEYEKQGKNKSKASIKVAPVFLKSTPKPKVKAEVIEARKKFLFSGIPDLLKKTVEKQKSIVEKEYDPFPAVSHVQQKCDSKLWELTHPNLHYLKQCCPLPLNVQNLKCHNLIIKTLPYEINLTTEVTKLKHLKTFIQEIKSQNPDYPVFKVFRHIHEKSGKSLPQTAVNNKKRNPKRRSKKSPRKFTPVEEVQSESFSKDHEMWTEKYNPRSSEEILGNYRSVNDLRKWLEMWMNYSEEINARKRKRANSNSESEFESTDCDSRDSTRLPGNTIVLYGPPGSGKTSAVYAIANELRFNVLELNASTKRTGKRLLQELQEATRSHQVRKSDASFISNSMNSATKRSQDSKNSKSIKQINSDQKDTKKMCILLLEDIDIIFEQDEGFLSSLAQLIGTSKRPIILTTTDSTPPHVQKFISQYECISFKPLSLQCLAVWLQIVCLVEGLFVDKYDLGNLLEYNRGDIRKTLLEVQFWCQSGGQLEENRRLPLKIAGNSTNNVSDLRGVDEVLQIDVSEDEGTNKKNFIHKHCLGSFEIFRVNQEYSIPQNFDLSILWWNLPNILGIPSSASERLQGRDKSHFDLQETTSVTKSNKLNLLSNLYDSLILTDSLLTTIQYHRSNEPVVKNWSFEIMDSQELTERTEDPIAIAEDLVHDLSHSLLNGCIDNYGRLEGTSCALNMALPDSNERKWRANQHMCEDFLKSPIPLSNVLDRSSIALDYLPTIRDIARSEEKRAGLNTKRRNRFRHYLKDLNMNFKPNTCKLACNILNIEWN